MNEKQAKQLVEVIGHGAEAVPADAELDIWGVELQCGSYTLSLGALGWMVWRPEDGCFFKSSFKSG